MSSSHILGKFRYPICYGVTALVLIGALINSRDIASGLMYAAFAFALSWLATTEKGIKFGIAAIVGVLVFGVALSLSLLLTVSQDVKLLILALGGPVVSIAAAYFTYKKLNNSNWIGEPCPQCHGRGRLTHSVVDKQYLGQKIRKTGYGDNTVTNSVYRVTTQHSCIACSHAWTTTKEKEEHSSGNSFGMGPVN
jgi:hypothetical protein